MAMKFKDHLEGDIVVFELSGRMVGGDDATRFHGRIHEYLNLDKKKVLLDLEKVDWTNSQGLGMLTSVFATINKAEGRLVLTNINGIENLLALTRLITVFENYETREEATAVLQS
jgi:anti-anti-sigma factor